MVDGAVFARAVAQSKLQGGPMPATGEDSSGEKAGLVQADANEGEGYGAAEAVAPAAAPAAAAAAAAAVPVAAAAAADDDASR